MHIVCTFLLWLLCITQVKLAENIIKKEKVELKLKIASLYYIKTCVALIMDYQQRYKL